MAPIPFFVLVVLLAAVTSQSHERMILQAGAATSQDEQQAAAAVVVPPPGCPDKCGDISIPFPFGMGKPDCFRPGFEVTCNDSFTPPRAFLGMGNGSYSSQTTAKSASAVTAVELMDISVTNNEARAYGAVRSRCYRNATNLNDYDLRVQLTQLGLPFALSAKRNVLVGVGPGTEVRLVSLLFENLAYDFLASCLTRATGAYGKNGTCDYSCCSQSNLPDDDREFGVLFVVPQIYIQDQPCSYGMVVQSSWYNFSTPDVLGYQVLSNKLSRGVPFVIDFAIRNTSSWCPAEGQQPPQDYACVSGHSSCANVTRGYVCHCSDHFQGNPYITDGCKDINECDRPDLYPCSNNGICHNTVGGYECPCKSGMKGDGKAGTCTEKFPLAAKAAVGAVVGILVLAFLSFVFFLRKEKRKTKEFYRKNGGPTLEKAKMIKLFKKEELKPILKISNIIGKGGFGEVYKGLVDNVLVAVKKPIGGNVLENEQFANEVIIQSQVIHKNIVRLIGCCLEVDTPMLVYEFLPRGSLDDILHGDNKVVPLNLNLRLNIAAESAHGLAYMHSQAHTKILHGDVKPANILLNDNFVPKISDFGISKLIAKDKEHATTIIGDKSYMDPVYLQSGLLTEKSDVYSFGVVILELISRKKATHSDNNSLVRNFLEHHKKGKKPTELFDKEITATEDLELLGSLAGIAVECLTLDVDERPSMTDVAERLLILNRSRRL